MLRGRAQKCWEIWVSFRGVEYVYNLPWETFKERFLLAFAPEAELKMIRREFLDLRQSHESVSEITGKFQDMVHFCLEYLENEWRMMNHYHDVLKSEIREFIKPNACDSFEKMVDEARDRELEIKKKEMEIASRRSEYQYQTPYKKQKIGGKDKKEDRREEKREERK